MNTAELSKDVLAIDAPSLASAIEDWIRKVVFETLRRRGAVVGISGGIDSSVVATLCARALGKERVFGIFMPEADSSDESLRYGQLLSDFLGIRSVTRDITKILEALQCYEQRDAAVRSVIPEYSNGYRCKIVLPNIVDSNSYSLFSVVAQSPSGDQLKRRLTPSAYLQILAATNCKQRTRKLIEYEYADQLHYAVAGTPNRLEYELGFFVKNGDGSADFKPIAHLYKSQVYQLAAYLEIPEPILHRAPTTDTYSLPQSQEEFYFSLPLEKMDLCLFAIDRDIAAEEVARVLELSVPQVERVYNAIRSRRNVASYLHAQPLTISGSSDTQQPCCSAVPVQAL